MDKIFIHYSGDNIMRVQVSFFDRKLHFTLETVSPLLNILGFLLHHSSLLISTNIHTTLLQTEIYFFSLRKIEQWLQHFISVIFSVHFVECSVETDTYADSHRKIISIKRTHIIAASGPFTSPMKLDGLIPI